MGLSFQPEWLRIYPQRKEFKFNNFKIPHQQNFGESIGWSGCRNFLGDLRHLGGEYHNLAGAQRNLPGGSIEIFCATPTRVVLRKLALRIVTAWNLKLSPPLRDRNFLGWKYCIVTFWEEGW
jgi:hypothetical protein